MKSTLQTKLSGRERCVAGAMIWLVVIILFVNLVPSYTQEVNGSSLKFEHTAAFNPYIVAIPGSGLNSSTLLVSAGQIDEQIEPVYMAIDQGPTSRKYSYTMSFDAQNQAYRYTLENFFDNPGPVSGSIEITTTTQSSTTLTSSQRKYDRWPVDRESYNQLQTSDGHLALYVVPETLPAQLAFIAVVETHAPVAAPDGWMAISHAYSIQASGSVGSAERAYLLTLQYDPDQLDPTRPDLPVIHWYDSVNNQWVAQDSQADAEHNIVTLSTQHFGTFILFAAAPLPTMTETPIATDTPTPTPTATDTPTFTPTATPTDTRSRDNNVYMPFVMQ